MVAIELSKPTTGGVATLRKFLYCFPLIAAQASAHDFWLQPDEFLLQASEATDVRFYVGHGADRNQWTVSPSHLVAVDAWSEEGSRSLLPALRQMDGKLGVRFQAQTPGAYLLTLEGQNSRSELPADRFNDYVEEEGLSAIANDRARTGSTASPGTELYSRRAKSLLFVGDVPSTLPNWVTTPVGQTLEIVPVQLPLNEDGPAIVRVLYEGEPSCGALVKLTDLSDDSERIDEGRTASNGEAALTLSGSGPFQFNVVWSVPSANGVYSTIFSSFTFDRQPSGTGAEKS